MKKILSGLLAAIFILSGCSSPFKNAQKQPEETGSQKTSQISDISLADLLKAQPVLADSADFYRPKNSQPNIKESETDPLKAENLDLMKQALKMELTPQQAEFLTKNKFLLLDDFQNHEDFCFSENILSSPGDCGTSLSDGRSVPDHMLALFEKFSGSGVDYLRTPVNALYINSDVILHAYHVFLDRYFKRLEQRKLAPLLRDIVERLQKTAFESWKNASDKNEKDSLERVAGFLTLGKILLDTSASPKPSYFQTPEEEAVWRSQDENIDQDTNAFFQNLTAYQGKFTPEYYEKMKAELSSIVAAKNVGSSPMFSLYNPNSPTDYTQFTPRSHYNENSLLRAYFRSMILFGRQTFYFASKEGLTDASVLTALIRKSGVEEDWAKFADVTDFLAGASDDITYRQFGKALTAAIGANPEISSLFVSGNLEKIAAEATKLPNPKILSDVVVDPNVANMTKEELLIASKGLRLFGQKFTFDAWILNQMTAGQEQTEIALPSTPSAIFVAGALGSDLVENLLPEWIEQSGDHLEAARLWQKILSLRAELEKMTTQNWLGNISSAWLWTLTPLLQEYGSGYPTFMKTALYQNKNLQTVLASYTELKHDTLLYAKQSYAELGGGRPDEKEPPKIVKGFVEPDLEFWNRMIALTEFTRGGLASRDLLEDDIDSRLQMFLQNLYFYQDFTVQELANTPIPDSKYEELRTNFWKVSQLIIPFDGEEVPEKDKKPALIADIHTDALKSQILYEATGNPLIMLAFVSDQGTPRLVIGTAYRHFELTGPLDRRYTDEEWKARVDKNDLPETPFFYRDILPAK